MWLLLLLRAIFSSTYTLGKSSLFYAAPVFSVSIRLMLSGVALIVVLLFQRKPFAIQRRDIVTFVLLSFFLFYSYVPDYMVLPYMSTTKWALIYTLTPFCTALISYFYRSETMTWQKILGLFIGLGGILFVLLGDANGHTVGGLWRFSWPELVMLLCMMSYSYGWVMARRLIRQRKYPAMLVNGIGMFIGGGAGMITSLLVENWSVGPVSAWGPFLAVIIPLIGVTTIAFTMNTYLLQFYTVTFLMFLTFIDPLYVALYGRVFLGEQIHWNFFVAVGMLFVGLYLFYKEELKQCYIEN